MTRIINGVVFEDGQPGTRIINLGGGNYVERLDGDFVQGSVVNLSVPPNNPPRKEASEAGVVIDVDSETV